VLDDALGGRYQIIGKLGAGGFGDVYKAQDSVLKRTVAIKRVRLESFAEPAEADELKERFLREAQVAAQLHHPNIVTTYDIVSTASTTFIVMEFVEGETLQSLLAARKCLSLPRAIDILAQVAAALDYAHRQTVIHRDVKPANILLTASDEVKVTDFGTAKAEFSSTLTMNGSLVGTPDYMSPEQARGERVDAKSDLFSLGCILYECLSGQKPFRRSSVTGVLLAIVSDDPFPLDCNKLGLPTGLRAVLERALAKELSQRFGSAADLIQALRAIPPAAEGSALPAIDPQSTPSPPIRGPHTEHSREGTSRESRDSVADTLMKEARRTTKIEPHLTALLSEHRPLRLVASPLLNFQNVTLTPEEAFILSRIDGHNPPRDIFVVSPLSEQQTARTLLGLLRAGIIELDRPSDRESSRAASPAEKPETAAAPEQYSEERQEIERLFQQWRQQNHWQVLGLEPGANLPEIKRAFQEKAFRYHPDRHRHADDPDFRQKLSYVFGRVSEAFTALAKEAEAKRHAPPTARAPLLPAGGTSLPPPSSPGRREATVAPPGDKQQHAKALYLRAKRAFDRKDYWEAVQCARQATEMVQDRAEYFHVLGLALAQNPNWQKEAQESLLEATNLDPFNAEYFGALGILYRRAGMHSRARGTFEIAKSIDPNYAVPEEE